MITNIVATVLISLITNVTEVEVEWSMNPVVTWQSWADSVTVNQAKGEPLAKVITTNIVEVTTLTFDWMDETRTVRYWNPKTTNSVLWRLKKEWVPTEEPPKDPDIYQREFIPGMVIMR